VLPFNQEFMNSSADHPLCVKIPSSDKASAQLQTVDAKGRLKFLAPAHIDQPAANLRHSAHGIR